jgi:hypothetical protein
MLNFDFWKEDQESNVSGRNPAMQWPGFGRVDYDDRFDRDSSPFIFNSQ